MATTVKICLRTPPPGLLTQMAVGGMARGADPPAAATAVARLALGMLECTEGLVTVNGDVIQIRVGLHAGVCGDYHRPVGR